MIQITNYQFNNYLINYNINQDEKVGVYFMDNSLTKKFLLNVAGINKGDHIYYRSRKVFDNSDYFKERIYLDCTKPLLNTLVGSKISKNLHDNYGVILNVDKFNQLITSLEVRREGKIKDNYEFSSEGLALTKNALALSTFKYPILLFPFEAIAHEKRLNLIKDKYFDKGMLVGVSEINKYKDFLDKIMFFSNDKLFIFNKDDKLMVLDNVVSQKILIDEGKLDNIVVYKSNISEKLIIKAEITKEQVRVMNELKVKRTEISVFDIGDYLC